MIALERLPSLMPTFQRKEGGDVTAPLEEREDAAKELFREFAITEDEQLAWLEPLLEA